MQLSLKRPILALLLALGLLCTTAPKARALNITDSLVVMPDVEFFLGGSVPTSDLSGWIYGDYAPSSAFIGGITLRSWIGTRKDWGGFFVTPTLGFYGSSVDTWAGFSVLDSEEKYSSIEFGVIAGYETPRFPVLIYFGGGGNFLIPYSDGMNNNAMGMINYGVRFTIPKVPYLAFGLDGSYSFASDDLGNFAGTLNFTRIGLSIGVSI